MQSHPLWVRGLKPFRPTPKGPCRKSHPLWVRGLKRPFPRCRSSAARVASFMGAWIETNSMPQLGQVHPRRILYGCVD